MRNSVALLAVASAAYVQAQQVGPASAVVVNYCNFDIPYNNVPGGGGSLSELPPAEGGVLAAGNSGPNSIYSQKWWAIGGTGWSIKLDPLHSNFNDSQIMQFEYTLTSPTSDTIWFDMSLVNGVVSGLPNFCFNVEGRDCTNNAYKYPTDDAFGMQKPVMPATGVTAIMCPESSSAPPNYSGGASAPSSTAAASPAPAPASTSSAAPAPSSSSTTLATSASTVNPGKNVDNSTPVIAASVPSTTKTTTTTPAPEYDVVTEYATEVVTAFVTETASATPKHKRHEHRHPHHHAHHL